MQKDLNATLEPKSTRDKLLYMEVGMAIAENAGLFSSKHALEQPVQRHPVFAS